MTRNYQQLQHLAAKKGHSFFDNGEFNLNLWFERSGNTITDLFDDIGYIGYRENGVPKVYQFACSTDAGRGETGSTVCPGQYKGNIEWVVQKLPDGIEAPICDGITVKVNPFIYDYGKQRTTLKVWDNNGRDIQTDLHPPHEVGYVGLHIHLGGWKGEVNPKVGAFSRGCFIMGYDEYLNIAHIMRKAIKASGSNIFTRTVIESHDWNLLA